MKGTTMRRGFTLLELLVAVSLSSIIIVTAYAAFNMASEAMGTVNRTARQNQLLRIGALMALDDADRWNTHANPSWPYLRGFNAFESVYGTSNVDSDKYQGRHYTNRDNYFVLDNTQNLAWDKRPFRPVAFETGDVEKDPNWTAAHDHRLWYRNHLYGNMRPSWHRSLRGNYSENSGLIDNHHVLWPSPRSSWTNGGRTYNDHYAHPKLGTEVPDGYEARTYQVPTSIDDSDPAAPVVNTSNESVTHQSSVTSKVEDVPAGWTPRHTFGDYANIANIGMDPLSSESQIAAAATRPRSMLWMFDQLGMNGLIDYMPNGMVSMILAPDRRGPLDDPRDTSTAPSYMGDLIQRLMDDSTNLTATGSTDWSGAFIPASETNDFWSIGEVPWSMGGHSSRYWNEGDAFWVARPTQDQYPDNNRRSIWHSLPSSRDRPKGIAQTTRGWNFDYARFIPSRMNRRKDRDGSIWRTWDWLDKYNTFPWQDMRPNGYNDFQTGIRTDLETRVRVVPSMPMDSDFASIDSADDDVPSLNLNTFRFYRHGQFYTYLTVTVYDPLDQSRLRLAFTAPVSTTYRGARQMWALETWGRTTADQPDMGDYYVNP